MDTETKVISTLIILILLTIVSTVSIITYHFRSSLKIATDKGYVECQSIGQSGFHWTKPELCKH